MRRAHPVVLTYALPATGVCALAQGSHSDTSRPFNGLMSIGSGPNGVGGHGFGDGDVNGDGTVDVLQGMFVSDVDGDKLPGVLTAAGKGAYIFLNTR